VSTARPAGFCFSCSTSLSHLQSEPRPTTTLPSAWPSLVPEFGLDHIRSQPVLRLWYWPIPWEDVLQRLRDVGATSPSGERKHSPQVSDALQTFSFMHEMGHLWYLDWTPAKEVARTEFAISYGLVAALMYSHRTDANLGRIWPRLRASQDRLDTSGERINLVEETVATAAAVEAIKSQTGQGERWSDCAEEMESFVAEVLKEAGALPGFSDLFPAAIGLVREMRSSPAVVAAVVPLLQGVGPEPRGAVDRTVDLRSLWLLLKGASSTEEKLRRLQPLNAQHDHEWKAALASQLEAMVELDDESDRDGVQVHNFARRLWQISKGEPDQTTGMSPAQLAASSVSRFRGTIGRGDRIGPGSTLLIQPTTLGQGGPGMLSVSWWSDTIENEGLKADHLRIAIMEALRQQIRERRGFICPYYGAAACACGPFMREGIGHLYDLGRAGLFGPGDWSRPPCGGRT
jgi:hypothetical protein